MSFMFIFPIIFIVLFIYLGQAVWIYNDSKKRGDENGLLWSILSLVSFPVPFIIYLIVSRYGRKKCINCGHYVDRALNICPYCGEKTNEVCKSCGYPVEKDWVYCPKCNEKLDRGSHNYEK